MYTMTRMGDCLLEHEQRTSSHSTEESEFPFLQHRYLSSTPDKMRGMRLHDPSCKHGGWWTGSIWRKSFVDKLQLL